MSMNDVTYLNASPVVNLSDAHRWLEIAKLDIDELKERVALLEHALAKVVEHGKP